ncbi:MAG: AraC family transcriptional regulator [Verrucomicrobiae bacterium]
MPNAIYRAGMWHQSRGCHPKFATIQRGIEFVEVVRGGRGWVKIGTKWVEVTRGALLWHVEGDLTIARSDWNDPYRCFVVGFETERFLGIRRTPRLTWWHDSEEVERFSHEIIRAHLDEGFDRKALLHYAYGRLLFQSQMWQHTTKEKPDLPPKLVQALALMEKHPDGRIAIRQLAREIGWSAPHLHEVFQKHLGVTPYQFILRRRMRLAQEQLSLTNDPIKKISAECGFTNTSSFCSAFKLQIGLTPLEYRRKESCVEKQL